MIPQSKKVEIHSGFYPSIAYLLPSTSLSTQPFLSQLTTILTQSSISYQPITPLHLSLTKTIYPLQTQLNSLVYKFTVYRNSLKMPIPLFLERIRVLDNFIVVQVKQKSVSQEKLMKIVKEVQKITNVPFYQKPILHVSLVKILGEIPEDVLERILGIQVPKNRCFNLDAFCLKTGKTQHLLK